MPDMIPEGGFDVSGKAASMMETIKAGLAAGGQAAPTPEAAPAAAPATPTAPATPAAQPAPKPGAEATPATPAQPAPATAPAPGAEPVVPEGVTGEGEDEALTPEEISEAEQLLSEAGIELGITYAEVPPELQPAYARLVQTTVDAAQTTLQQRFESAELVEQVKEFAQRLQDSPDKLLLSLAVRNPEAFRQAVEVFNEMQTDERVKNLVVRELQAEARLREAERKERVNAQTGQQGKIQRVIAATRRAAATYGVPFAAAENVVAMAIKGNGGDIEITAVDQVVKEHAAALGRQGRQKVRLATPQKVAAAAAAPNQPAGNAAPPPQPGAETPSKGLQFANPHSRFKNIIRTALAKTREGAQ